MTCSQGVQRSSWIVFKRYISSKYHENYKKMFWEKDTCIIALVMFYDTKTKKNPKTLYMVLSFVFYWVIDDYLCIDYLYYTSKTLSVISSDKIFEEASYNKLLGIGTPEVLMNLISCHVFMKKPNSTVILVFWSCLVNYYLAKQLLLLNTTLSS